MMHVLLTRVIARQNGRTPFFFSRFNWDRIRERGNTHYCFDCGGKVGFALDADGNVTNQIEQSGYNPMSEHHADHTAVIGDADKYANLSDWLHTIPSGFPYVVTVPPIY